MNNLESILVLVAVILLVSVIASKAASRSGIPTLLMFIALGMALGSEGPGRIFFDNAALTQSIGVIALVFILFSGGLETEWAAIRPVLREGLMLATVGVAVTAVAVGAFCVVVLGFDWLSGIMVGAILGSTDAAAVFAVLRGRGVSLRKGLAPILELESGSNDPMAIFLSLGMIGLLTDPNASPLGLIPSFILQMSVGAAFGVALGRAALWTINRIRLEYDGLYPALTVGYVLLIYAATALAGGNGFLAVYIAGIILGRREFIHKNSLSNFHEGLAWLMQIAMFLTLGLQVYPSEVVSVAGEGLLAAAFVMLVARPLSVFVATFRTPLRLNEKLFISWVGLRGAAPIVLATFPLLAGVRTPVPVFDLVFFVVLASVALQGTTLPLAARLLRVRSDDPKQMTSVFKQMARGGFGDSLLELSITPKSASVGQMILDLGLPHDVLIVLIRRRGELVVPRGGTVIEIGDDLLIVARADQHAAMRWLLAREVDAV